jgi:3-oxoacyl-(acyl-carrier-protein) synthase
MPTVRRSHDDTEARVALSNSFGFGGHDVVPCLEA